MFDADNHLYESADAFTRHLAPERAADVFWVKNERGHQHLVVDGTFWDYIPNPTFDPIAIAGSLTEFYSGETSMIGTRLDGLRQVEPLDDRPEYGDPVARLARLDEQNVEKCMLFPTLASGIEEVTRDNPALTADLMWAFARWFEDDWGFAHADRIFAAPPISLAVPEEALKLLNWVIERGARAIMVRPAPVPRAGGSCSPGDPVFDPFWARCAEAGIIVNAHLADSGYSRYSGEWSGTFSRRGLSHSSFESIYQHGRAISDFISAMICHGAITRHPTLKIASIENGGEWVPELLQKLKLYYHRFPGTFPEDPIAAFERAVWVAPYWEDDADELARHMPVERILAGSDFPHADGLAEPIDFIKSLNGFTPDQERLIMRDNLRSLLAN